mgnify:CR=1 FL=1
MKVQKFILVYFCLVFIFSCDDSAVGSFPNSELPPGTVLESYDNIEDLSRARVYEGDVLIATCDHLRYLVPEDFYKIVFLERRIKKKNIIFIEPSKKDPLIL